MTGIDAAQAALCNGEMVIVFDSERRENESDFVVAAEFCRSETIRTMRSVGGGLLFLAIAPDIAQRFSLPFLEDFYQAAEAQAPVLQYLRRAELAYDSRSAFSFSLNHRSSFTGITDKERAFTVRRFAELAQATQEKSVEEATAAFVHEFRTPGHVQVCIAAEGLLASRQGHTELAVALSQSAALSGVCLGCELLHDSGRALRRKEAEELSRQMNLQFVDGRALASLELHSQAVVANL